MNPKIIKFDRHYMSVLLIICGGPIGKGNNKTIVLSATTTPTNKKQTKENIEEEKKPASLNKTK
ncbi:hypothetical protein [Sphingobacterium sp. BIGb0165]|uniref:hypothetical protein n=1 Tax=Sphingobacterium sp. BIGb0165 TaxID=2940615 RepID=UPI00216771E9|nr:hypothetical protein [Sphingobacterium sp. BIGb0165]MCS4224417.1 hypothetical protein [Sphingobacterium sp. BIGb0165]